MSDAATAYQGPKRIYSGMQPSGDLHLGNYLGALINWVKLQEEWECVFCAVDLHAITVPQDPKKLASQTREITAAWLAAGVDPDKSIVYAQSSVPAHSELAWILNCTARMGWVERMTQFKDKAGKDSERASVGLFTYPVLQAADILAFKGTHVPVGEDQKQHLELSRDIADRFNRDFDAENFFPQPEPLIQGPGARVMSLKDGTKKMSKSDPSELSRINFIDDADVIAKKIKKAKSDADALPSEVEGLEGRPEARNLVGIYGALAEKTNAEVLAEFGGEGFGKFKPALAELAVEKLSPITQKMRSYMDDPAQIDSVLKKGAEKANAISEPIIKEVREIVGFWNT